MKEISSTYLLNKFSACFNHWCSMHCFVKIIFCGLQNILDAETKGLFIGELQNAGITTYWHEYD